MEQLKNTKLLLSISKQLFVWTKKLKKIIKVQKLTYRKVWYSVKVILDTMSRSISNYFAISQKRSLFDPTASPYKLCKADWSVAEEGFKWKLCFLRAFFFELSESYVPRKPNILSSLPMFMFSFLKYQKVFYIIKII